MASGGRVGQRPDCHTSLCKFWHFQMAVSQWNLTWLTPNLRILWISVSSFWLCESLDANPIIYRLVPRPSRFETRQYSIQSWKCDLTQWHIPISLLLGSIPSGFYLSLATFAALILFISSDRCCLAWISACRFACSDNISCLSTFCDLLICHWFFSPCNTCKNKKINSTFRLQSNLSCVDVAGQFVP